MKNVGIDIGGTKVYMGIVDENGAILADRRIATHAPGTEDDPNALIKRICGEIKKLLSDSALSLDDINFIGAGFPGTVDTERGHVVRCPNLNMNGVDAGAIFEKHLGRTVLLAQDSHLAALGELLFGAGRGMSNIACVTIGTGIGCGIIINKKIYRGAGSIAGELGHICVHPGGDKCGCGHLGCLERYSSGTGIIARALEQFPEKFTNRPHKTEEVFALANEGDADAIALIDRCMDELAAGLAFIISVLSPDGLFISGGLCVHEELVTKPLIAKTWARSYPPASSAGGIIDTAKCGGKAPMLGASALYRG